jgi:hypothetical protein
MEIQRPHAVPPGGERRRADDKKWLSRLPKSFWVWAAGVSWTVIIPALFFAVLSANEHRYTQLETAIAQSNVEVQNGVLQRLTANEADIRNMKEANQRRDAQIDRVLDGLEKLTKRLEVYIATRDARREGP